MDWGCIGWGRLQLDRAHLVTHWGNYWETDSWHFSQALRWRDTIDWPSAALPCWAQVNMSLWTTACVCVFWCQISANEILTLKANVQFRNRGRFSICVLVCTCEYTVPIQSSHLAKYRQNPRMCSCSTPFMEDASRGDLCELEAVRYPKMHFAPISER